MSTIKARPITHLLSGKAFRFTIINNKGQITASEVAPTVTPLMLRKVAVDALAGNEEGVYIYFDYDHTTSDIIAAIEKYGANSEQISAASIVLEQYENNLKVELA